MQKIEINIPDLTFGEAFIKAKASAVSLVFHLELQYVSIVWKITFYESIGGKYGDPVNKAGMIPYTKELKADNTVMVDPLTGDFVEKDLETDEYPEGSVGQYDFFFFVAENVPSKVNDLIRAYGLKNTSW